MTPHVVCVGEIMSDTVALLPGPLLLGSDTPTRLWTVGGGSAANTACWLSADGGQATLISRVGADELGRQSVRALQRAGVACSIVLDEVAPTGRCLVLVSSDGERTMAPDAGENANLSATDVSRAEFVTGRHLHLSGYLLFGAARAAGVRALELARAARMSISVDVASAGPIRAMGAEAFLQLLGPDVLVIANADEATVLLDDDRSSGAAEGSVDPGSAALTLARRFGSAVVKVGKSGAVWSDGHDVVDEPSEAVHAMDTTGAGDAFAAGLLTVLLTSGSPSEALKAGHALGRAACLLVGGRPAPA